MLLYHGNKEERAVLRRTRLRPCPQGLPVVVTSYEIARFSPRFPSRPFPSLLPVEPATLTSRYCPPLTDRSFSSDRTDALLVPPLLSSLYHLYFASRASVTAPTPQIFHYTFVSF